MNKSSMKECHLYKEISLPQINLDQNKIFTKLFVKKLFI